VEAWKTEVFPLATHPNPTPKQTVSAKTGVTSKDDLKTEATGALRRLQKLPALVRGFFRDPNLAYITA
jgi:hypothetical protein